jgi:hypothetical protein
MRRSELSSPTHCEQWRTVRGRYLVSNLGRVRALRTDRDMCVWVTQGYLYVRLWDGVAHHNTSVHSLVAEAFIGLRPSALEINHRDGNKRNNWPGNLEYITHRQNIQHGYNIGLTSRSRPSLKLSAADREVVRGRLVAGELPRVVAQEFGISVSYARNIRRGWDWRRGHEAKRTAQSD